MAQSSASKKRKHSVRSGKRDPQQDRIGWNGVRPVERMTPSLKQRRGKLETKHKALWTQADAPVTSIE